jgi:phage shock protein C
MNNSSEQSWFCNKTHRKIYGVCAGLAACYQQPIWIMRLLAIALLFVFPVAAIVAYLAAAFLLPDRYQP